MQKKTHSLVEIWKDIPGYENIYQASNLGNIRSLNREWKGNNGAIRKHGIIVLKKNIRRNGYIYVVLRINNKQNKHNIHRLVLSAFYGKSKLQCNHIDGNKKNNHVENLEYCTSKQNMIHALNNGFIKTGENSINSKLKNNHVNRIRFLNGKVERGYFKKLSKALDVSDVTIYNILNYRTYKNAK